MIPKVVAANSRAERTRCHLCGRKVGPEVGQCRQARSGWFCQRDGLIYDPALLIYPTPDPIGEAEQEVIDTYADQIAEAQKIVDEALASFTVAQTAHLQGLQEAAEMDVVSPVTTVHFLGSPPRWRREHTEQERQAMRRRLQQLYDRQEAAEKRLKTARATLNDLEYRCDLERRAAKPSTIWTGGK